MKTWKNSLKLMKKYIEKHNDEIQLFRKLLFSQDFNEEQQSILMDCIKDVATIQTIDYDSLLDEINMKIYDTKIIEKTNEMNSKMNIKKSNKGNHKNLKDLTGKKFGKLTVLKRLDNKSNSTCWLCECDCGGDNKFVESRGNNLSSGRVRSCGCIRKGSLKPNRKRRPPKQNKIIRHKRLSSIYYGIKNRCTNENEPSFEYYGGRGIKMYAEWLKSDGIDAFIHWALNNGYADNLSIDRIDVNGNYEPSNCRWATVKEQQNNKRNNLYLEIDGVLKKHSEWEEENGLYRNTIQSRIRQGWDTQDLLKPPKKPKTTQPDTPMKGITKNSKNNKWKVCIRGFYIGEFVNVEEAKRAKEDYIINKQNKI